MSNLKPLAAATLLVLATAAFAQQPAVVTEQQRQANQQARISQGVSSGQLTPHETQRLEKEQARITTAETKAEADGTVTAKESKHVSRMQDRASKSIYRQKHDRQVVAPAAAPAAAMPAPAAAPQK
jgi:hypothetical protein